ncbi:MAG: hypothetical protein V6Z81_06435 [Parvularculales bacterium]
MLIREKKTQKNQAIHRANEDVSTAGKQKFAEAEKLQGSIQGSLSDMVREHDKQISADPSVMSDETFNEEWEQSLSSWHDEIGERHGGKPAMTQRKRIGVIRAGGGYVRVKRDK